MTVKRHASPYMVLGIIAFMAAGLTFLGGASLTKGLSAANAARELKDSGLVATVKDVRIHTSRTSRKKSVNVSYSVDHVQVVFADKQGNDRSDDLNNWFIQGSTPRATGWTSQFEGHDKFIGKQVMYLPNRTGRAQMSENVTATLAHGYDPASTYIGIGVSVLAILAWFGFAKMLMAKRRKRQS